MGLYELTQRLEELEGLDPVGKKIAASVARALPHGAIKDLLSGTWLGHSLHPLLTDVPIGVWMSASALDVLGGEDTERAAELLIALGLAGSVPTAAAGLADWSDTIGGERRVGLVHAAGNSAVALLYAGSLWARRRGRRGLGVSLGLAGLGITVVSAHLGAHLSLGLGVGVDHAAFEDGPTDWVTAMPAAELGDEPHAAEVDGTRLVVVRRGDRICALADRCSHLGGPLHEGEVSDDAIVCPWHGSTFRLDDGAVVSGPARSPQPAFAVRVQDGDVQVRLRSPSH
jgi:nitrite reductase/ring-hydroxylating ferredoxin subunit/uncharacterized membrane protein